MSGKRARQKKKQPKVTLRDRRRLPAVLKRMCVSPFFFAKPFCQKKWKGWAKTSKAGKQRGRVADGTTVKQTRQIDTRRRAIPPFFSQTTKSLGAAHFSRASFVFPFSHFFPPFSMTREKKRLVDGGGKKKRDDGRKGKKKRAWVNQGCTRWHAPCSPQSRWSGK